MYDRLKEVKRQHKNKKKEDFFGVTLHPRDIDWLIEQAERAKIYKDTLMEIGAKHEPPSSKLANDALFMADYHREYLI